MRRKRADASKGSTLSSSSSSTSAADPFVTPAKGGSRPSSRAPYRASLDSTTQLDNPDERVYPGEHQGTQEADDGLTQVERNFNLEPQRNVIAKAKKTGKPPVRRRSQQGTSWAWAEADFLLASQVGSCCLLAS